MLYKYEYSTEQERHSILDANTDKFLIEEQNITEGNFLIFSAVLPKPEIRIVYKDVPEEEINDLKLRTQDIELVLADIVLGGM